MISRDSFFSELAEIEKTAAQKCRKGSTPIRAHNLAKKSKYDGRGKKTTKLAFYKNKEASVGAIIGSAGKALSKAKGLGGKGLDKWKALAPETKKLVGVGAAGVGTGAVGTQAAKDWSLGRRVRKAQGG